MYVCIYKNCLFSTGNNTGLIIGVTVGSVLTVCTIILIIIILVLFVRQYRIIKYAAKKSSSNDYTEPPSMLRLFIL